MTGLVVTTWNVNSVRLRLDGLARLIAAEVPDVICLQEIKVEDGSFPAADIAALGYPHQLVHGMKSYNGLAFLARRPIEAIGPLEWCGRSDRRHLVARVDGVTIHNLYVPAGGDVPDPEVNEKFAHKLRFLDEITAYFAALDAPGPLIVTGDFNVAPLEHDVWSHRDLLDVVSHTPVEVARLELLAASRGWVDSGRVTIPADRKLYSWWSYRARDWEASDRGRRLDHVWLTPDLAPRLIATHTLRDARGWPQPSDHAPVTCRLS